MIIGSCRRRGIVAVTVVAVLLGVGGCSGDGPPPPPTTAGQPTPSASVPAAPTPTTAGSGPSSATTAASGAATASRGPSPKPQAPGPVPVTRRNPGWALDRIDQRRRPLDRRFTTVDQGKGVTVYVVDGLFDVKNPEFGGRASVGLARGRACSLEDGINHGLFVAGLVGGRRTGVAQQARIVSVGASAGCEGGNGDATQAQLTARVVRALSWVAEHARPPAVVNLSLNADAPAPEIATAVRRLVAAGLTVVASAGNDGEDACRHPPAGLPSVITVAASTKADRDAGLNHGRCVDLFAPAEGVTSVVDATLSPDRLATSQGAATSWAAPLVSGAAALYLSGHPTATPAQVRSALLAGATEGVLRGNLHGSPNRLLFTGG